MADGKMLSATEAAGLLKRDIDIVMQHFRILRNAGLVSWKPSEQDARFLLYYIPATWRPEPNVLNYGFCVLQLSTIPDYPIRKRR